MALDKVSSLLPKPGCEVESLRLIAADYAGGIGCAFMPVLVIA